MAILLLWVLVRGATFADITLRYRAAVVEVIDGNTIVVSNRLLREDVRLTGLATVKLDAVAAPRTDQPGGQEAKSFLEKAVIDKEVVVVERSEMGKSVGAWVFVGEEKKSLNLMMIEQGQAWLVEPRVILSVEMTRRTYDRMKDAFQEAKEFRRGIWAAENTVPPWKWQNSEGTNRNESLK